MLLKFYSKYKLPFIKIHSKSSFARTQSFCSRSNFPIPRQPMQTQLNTQEHILTKFLKCTFVNKRDGIHIGIFQKFDLQITGDSSIFNEFLQAKWSKQHQITSYYSPFATGIQRWLVVSPDKMWKTSWDHIEDFASTPRLYFNDVGLYSLSGRTSYRKISWGLEAAKFGFGLFQQLLNLTGTSAAALPRCL